jgi:NAD(P)H-dependent flavin oxidoreductase YrpB (nitropropane dioxygenase family)
VNKFEILQEKLSLEKPIIQGGMAVRISTAELAAVVSEAGGFGIIGASGMSPEELRLEIRKARKLTSRPFGVNIMAAVSAFKELLSVALEEKVTAVFVGAGFVREFFSMCRDAGVLPVPIVSSAKAAVLSERLGAEVVVFESGEAGGHLGTLEGTFSLLPEIVSAVKIPVIAAGGLASKEDIQKAFNYGAAAVQLGTVFAASEESAAHEDFKRYYLQAKSDDIVIIDSPAGLPGRALKNRFVEKVVLPEKKHEPKIIKTCIKCLKKCKRNFCILDSLICAQKGYIDEGLIFCGSKVEEVKTIQSAQEIISFLSF